MNHFYKNLSLSLVVVIAFSLFTYSAMARISNPSSGSSLSSPVAVSEGGTNATTFGSHQLITFDGTRLVASSTPTAAYYLATSSALASIFPQASSTQLSISGNLYIPTSATAPTIRAAGELIAQINTASTSLITGTTTANSGFTLFASSDISGLFASSTLKFINTSFGANSTTTLLIRNPKHPNLATNFYCKSVGGTVYIELGNNSASSSYDGGTATAITCDTTGRNVLLTGNNRWNARQDMVLGVGNPASGFDRVTWTISIQQLSN